MQARAAHQPDVGPRDRQDARRAVRRAGDRADARLRAGLGCERVVGQVRREVAARTPTGPTPGPPPPCGMQKVLCRLRCETSAPNLPGLGQPDERVEVGAVDVDLPAGVVDERAQLGDGVLEDAVRRRVGHHDRGEVVAVRLDLGPQVVHVDVAAAVGLDDDDLAGRPSPRWRRWCRARWPG